MISRNFIEKSAENFSEHNAKKFFILLPKYRKKSKIVRSVMTSMTMFSPN